jgi:hypothetical protein
VGHILGEIMRTTDLINAVYFLRRVFAGSLDEERLIRTIAALEAEIRRLKRDREQR